MESGIRERVSVGGETFTFTLCRKAERLGSMLVDHWWMPTTDLYHQRIHRHGEGANYKAVTEAFWALCRGGDSHVERDVQESYLLARLLPFARSQGSRRIVADAYLAPKNRAPRAEREAAVNELNELLGRCGTATMSRRRFSRRTADIIGPPRLTRGLKQAYQICCADLFDPAVAVLLADKEAGVARLLSAWRRLIRTVGRRGGRPVEKQVLDILSYEARAALHRCYSAAWDMLLLRHLTEAYQLSTETVAFLRLWHLDQVSESNLGDVAYFHLFHGHVFALHPATALFLSTPIGRELVGSWLVGACSNRAFGRLLQGILVAVHHYAGLRDDAAQRRRKQPQGFGGPNLIE
jgi:hypothetical protein